MGSSDKRESFPGPQHTSQADGPGLLALIGPSPVTAHQVAHRRNLSVTSEQAVLALWHEMVMERLPVHGPIHDRDSALPTAIGTCNLSLSMTSLATAVTAI